MVDKRKVGGLMSVDMRAGLLIVSVYRPDIYENALRSIGVARDLIIVLDRRVGERRQRYRSTGQRAVPRDRRRIDIDDQLRASGWAFVSAKEREALNAATALRSQ
jgi:hypothetical protein